MYERKTDILKLLEQGEVIQIQPKGYSMYPMLIPERDSVIIKRVEPETLKRGDVVLFRRDEGILVLHRIWKVKPEGVFLVGDNQEAIEGPIRKEQIKGLLVAFIRKGRKISVKNPFYRLYRIAWLIPPTLRFRICKLGGRLLRLFHIGKNDMDGEK
ncbi:MAG: S24/S26 family peptidase [Thermoclostridium sp.]|nr:S24/S26 family peptidase [Thermoclostridium sp.]